jgi:hypothetical protein
MTLKSIIKIISNDKILSILALFSVILIGTLMYYNLNEGLLNYNSRTLEYFEDNNDDGCDTIRSLINYPGDFETYPIVYNNPNIENITLIIDKSAKHEQIMRYMKYHISAIVNELNQTFPVNTFSPNQDFSSIKIIIKKFMSSYSSDLLEDIINKYQTYFNDARDEYTADITNPNSTTGHITQLPLYRYLTKIYKIVLNIIVLAKFQKFLNRLKGTDTRDGLINKYMNNPKTWRKRQIRNTVNALYRIHIPLMFINKNETNFKSVINYNWLSDGIPLNSGSAETITIPMNNNGDSDTSLPDTNVLEYNFNDDVPLSEYIINNNQIFENMIDEAGLIDSLKIIYDTKSFGYYHVFEHSSSIIKTYATADYDTCRETIEYENNLCSTCEEKTENPPEERNGEMYCGDEPCIDDTQTTNTTVNATQITNTTVNATTSSN